MAERTTVLRIKRQESPSKSSYWEEFEIPYKSNHNIISMLMEIRLDCHRTFETLGEL